MINTKKRRSFGRRNQVRNRKNFQIKCLNTHEQRNFQTGNERVQIEVLFFNLGRYFFIKMLARTQQKISFKRCLCRLGVQVSLNTFKFLPSKLQTKASTKHTYIHT